MLNLKISMTLLAAVLAITIGCLVVTNDYIGGVFEGHMIRDLENARQTVLRSDALAVHGQMAIAAQVGAWPKFAEKLLQSYPEGIDGLDERHQGIWEELNVWQAKLLAASKAEGHNPTLLEDRRALGPDEMFGVDASGAVVARLFDYAWWGNDIAKDLPVVLEVKKTRAPARDVWNPPGGGMMEITVGPIFSTPDEAGAGAEAAFLGSVVLGYKMSNDEAERLRALTGAEVCFFHGDQVYAGTLDVAYLKELQTQVVEQDEVRQRGRLGGETIYKLLDREYRVAVGLFASHAPGSTAARGAGFVLLLDRARYLQPIAVLNTYIPVAGAAIFLVMLILTAWISRGFIRPFEEIDQGIHEIINGNKDYVFPTSGRESLAGNMAHSLNMAVCTLLGKPIPEDEEAEGTQQAVSEWKDPLFIEEASTVRKRPEVVGLPAGLMGGPRKPRAAEPAVEPGAGSVESSVDAAPLAFVSVERIQPGRDTQELLIETEERYYKRLYDEYVIARQETGEGVKGVTLDKFVEKLKSSERQIREQLGCRVVRFRVQKKDGKATLKPIPIE